MHWNTLEKEKTGLHAKMERQSVNEPITNSDKSLWSESPGANPFVLLQPQIRSACADYNAGSYACDTIFLRKEI